MNQTGPLVDADEVTVDAIHTKKPKVKGKVVGTDANGIFLKVSATGANVFFPWTSISYIRYK
nr:hypothetical protein [Microbacterium testaceum]